MDDLKVGDYFKDIQMFYTMIAKVWKIDGDRIYFKPLNFDDWNEERDWFHCRSIRAEHIRIISEDRAMVEMI